MSTGIGSLVDELETTLLGQTQDTATQQAVNQTLNGAANLANLLPTGTVLAFEILCPIVTNSGNCTIGGQPLTIALLALCGLSGFVSNFTDSFKDAQGTVRYGLATLTGLWVIDGTPPPPASEAAAYRLKFIDFVHAFMSLLVFAAVALLNKNVVSCFFPLPSDQAEQLLTAVPICIGVLCSSLFITFPTTRHGIGFPVTPAGTSS